MSMTAVPTSIRLVRAAIAVSSGNGEASCRSKWCTRTKAPLTPSSSAAWASSMVCSSASAAVRVCDPGAARQCPNDRNPIFFTLMTAPAAAAGFPRSGGDADPVQGHRGAPAKRVGDLGDHVDVVDQGGQVGLGGLAGDLDRVGDPRGRGGLAAVAAVHG